MLSRLAWPGYHVAGGSLGKPLDGLLVSVHVPAGAAGRVVTVAFTPPGWRLELVCWWLSVLGSLAWSGLFAVAARRRTRRARREEPSPSSPGAEEQSGGGPALTC